MLMQVMGAMEVTTMATLLVKETVTLAKTVGMAALLQATGAMVAMEAMQLVVSSV